MPSDLIVGGTGSHSNRFLYNQNQIMLWSVARPQGQRTTALESASAPYAAGHED